jgi:hypothetical protein
LWKTNRRVGVDGGGQSTIGGPTAARQPGQALQVQGQAPTDLPLAAPGVGRLRVAAYALRGGGADKEAGEQPERAKDHPPAWLELVLGLGESG